VDLALTFNSFVHHKVTAMSLWKESTAAKPTTNFAPDVHEPPRFDAHAAPAKPEVAHTPAPAPAPAPAPVVPRAEAHARKESLIAADITIEGKIEGGGSVRIAGSFKGDVNVQGDLAIESGAKLTGSVRASNVTIAGELEGNIQEAKRVDLTQSAIVLGDVKSGTLTVVAGARMRGHADFGWDEGSKAKSNGFAGKSNVS